MYLYYTWKGVDFMDIQTREFTGNATFAWHGYNGGAEIIRVFADMPQVHIPEEIDGKKVISIGAYCFSEINKTGCQEVHYEMHEFCGNYIESVILPDNLEKLSDNAFYNCRNMSVLKAGGNIKEAGSGVFMNCHRLKKLYLRQRADAPGSLKQLVSRLDGTIEVYFCDGRKIDALLVYPEYTESYDEIAPAHIFGRNITGEGFRARQCFTGSVPDFGQYDSIFAKASIEESVDVIYKMALGRLMYPFQLSDNAKTRYRNYIKEHQKEIMEILVQERGLEELHFLCSNGYADNAGISNAVICASQAGWGEGAASLLQWQHEFIEDVKKNRYAF